MVRRFLFLVLFLFPAVAWSGTRPAIVQYSGITTMTFQDSVSPTAAYTGTEDTYICSAAADTGRNMGAGDSLRVSGTGNTATYKGDQNKILIKFDITALPDSAIITQAYLYLYQISGGTGSGFTDSLQAHRLLKQWNEGTGTNNGTAQAANADWNNRTGLTWAVAGANNFSAQSAASGWGTTQTIYGGITDSALVPAAWTGTDTLWSVATNFEDCARDLLATTRFLTGAGTLKYGWVVLDLTKQVRLWHIGANRNDGVLLSYHNGAVNTNKFFAFYSSDFNNRPDAPHYRPKLVVQFFDPEVAGSSGSGTGGAGKRIIGDGRAPKQ